MGSFLDYILANSTLDLSDDVDKNLSLGDVHVPAAGGDAPPKKKKKPDTVIEIGDLSAELRRNELRSAKSFDARMSGSGGTTGNAAVDYFNAEIAKLKLKQKATLECEPGELKTLLDQNPELRAALAQIISGGNSLALGVVPQRYAKAKMRTILLMRHGATHLNDDDTSVDRIRGWKNVPLSEEGKEEAAKLGEKVAKDPPDNLVSSDLKRAADTAKMVAAACDLKMSKGDLREGLRPWDVGKYAGQPSKKAVPILCDYAVNKPDVVVPEGESFNEFYQRFTSELAKALKDYPDGVLGVVSHHRNERVLKASEKAGWKPGVIDGKEFSKKGEGTAGFELIDIPQAWLDGVASGKVTKYGVVRGVTEWVNTDFDISKIWQDGITTDFGNDHYGNGEEDDLDYESVIRPVTEMRGRVVDKDFNPDEPRDERGRWTGDGSSKDKEELGHGYSDSAHLIDGVIYTNNVYDATRALYEGRRVELTQPRQVSTLIDHLGKVAGEWQKLGAEAPRFDLCKVSVSGTNLFCAETKGIPRIKMPQMDKQTTKQFIDYLKGRGYGIEKDTVPSNRLRATQVEIDGAKVAKGMDRLDADPNRDLRRIVVSRGDYILDGHHKWAAQIGVDARDGKLGNHETRVYRVDIGITKLLRLADKFTGGRGREKAFADEPFDFSGVFDDVDDDVSKEFTVEIKKVDAEQQIFYGWAYVSEENGQIVVDKQDDYILPADLLKAAEEFTLHGGKLGDMHDARNVGRVVASFVTTDELCKAFKLTPEGGRRGWILGFKVDDPQVWAKIKSGDQIELSIGGRGERVER